MNTNLIPLNQTYKIKQTFIDHPNIKKTYDEIYKYSQDHGFIKPNSAYNRPKGRIYDQAVLFNSPNVDFNNKVVCELGARDGIFGSWLTQFASKVYMSDYFEAWGKGTKDDLGQFEYWQKIWKDSAYNPDRLVCETQDMMKLTYPDNMFDIVICTSVIEHTFNQAQWMGDMIAIREMRRILKPGGLLLLSTDMGDKTTWHSGTLYYSETDLFDRIINPSKCKLNGEYNFSLDDIYNDSIDKIDCIGRITSVVFSLVKSL